MTKQTPLKPNKGSTMTGEKLLKIIDWATGDDTGVSSNALCRFMMGLPENRWGLSAPSDEHDRGRCIRLLNLIPEWWERLDELGDISYDWEKQIPKIMREGGKL